MRLAGIGVGQAGGKILDQLLEYDRRWGGGFVTSATAINTARTDLHGLELVPTENRILIGQTVTRGHGTGADNELGVTIADLDRFGTIAEWTKTRASQRGNQRVAQICEDCVDLGELQKRLILRGSPVAHSVAQVFQQSVMDNLLALQQHAHESEVQELIQQAQQVRNSLQQGLTAVPTTSTGQSGASAQSQPTY